MSQIIPIQPTPSQTVKTTVGNAQLRILIACKNQGTFVSINMDDEDISNNVLAHDYCPLIQSDYLGFPGNLMFIDTQGEEDPDYKLLGSRWILVYLTAEEYALI